MESLPGEMIAEIGLYLSVADLAACSATCRTWRERFNDDRIWRRRCTLRLAEYLENTDTTVPPGLQLTEHDSLSPLCKWRTRFIRENRLWNNWRQGNYTSHEMARIDQVRTLASFYGNDYLVIIIYNEVQLWNVRDVPTCLMTNPCDLDKTVYVDHFEILREDRIIFVQSSKVSVFRMSVTSTHWPLIYTFHFDERLSTADFTEEAALSPSEHAIITVPESSFYTITGDYFVGVAPGYTRLLHVWNIYTGEKLKEVVCPVSNPNSCFITLCHSYKPSPDVLSVVEEEVLEDRGLMIRMHVYVYNASELVFREFVETRLGRVNTLYQCMIYDPYVFIKDFFNLSVFNYKTSALVDVKPALSNPILFNDNVIYVRERKLRGFNVSTGVTNQLSSFNACSMYFIACDRFVTQVLSFRDFEVLEVGRRQARRHFNFESSNRYWWSDRVAMTNRMYTKKIMIESNERNKKHNIYILNFW
ncbi:uncharacterized protein LOC124358899 isoform X3 [Homalodisca vitripennis]|uniref:uncharacterized protein LOC124358899 isoform X3 n=1 Tax=Homalodisca vitripennis TaxID=197043 RepID=UPI001EECBA0C|nr:uncharacterized protein LOC124358899 isoform X3 [Homalodisca vitripennis]